MMFNSVDQLIPGVWTDDIREHPNSEYHFTYRDYNCRIRRNPMKWTWNGYIQLPPTHPFHGKKYSEIEDKISVHGGLTYGDSTTDGWYGFDCSHFDDISPADKTILAGPDNVLKKIIELSRGLSFRGEKYWSFDDVKNEIEDMVEQFQQHENPDTLEKVIEEFQQRKKITYGELMDQLQNLLSNLEMVNRELDRRENQ